MGLKLQLAIVAAISLILPWAGCEYIKETELALRDNQQQLLRSAAINIAQSVNGQALLAFDTDAAKQGSLYLTPLSHQPLLDGYGADWPFEVTSSRPIIGSANAEFRSGIHDAHVYLFISLSRDTVNTVNINTIDKAGQLRVFQLRREGRGESLAVELESNRSQPAVRGFWEPAGASINLEIRLPQRFVERGLGLTAFANNDAIASTHPSLLPPTPIQHESQVNAAIERFGQPGMRIHVIDSGGWIRASAGDSAPAIDRVEFTPIGTRLFRDIIDSADESSRSLSLQGGQDNNSYALEALQGTVASAWVTTDGVDELNAKVVAAAPIRNGRKIAGAVVLTQDSAARLLLSNAAMSRLTTLTLLATLGTALLLLAFAAWLSYRVRRLSRAADVALGEHGELKTRLPSNAARDEIGSLSRSFSTLLARVGDYNAYLRALAGRLSHELNTPLSVVSSSLDNLEAELPEPEQQPYLDRARAGVDRLRALVRAMSEATRVEEAASSATQMKFDLAALSQSAVEGYRLAYPDQRFSVSITQSDVEVLGAPNLILQLLDKIVANAVSFAAENTDITVSCEATDVEASVAIHNLGPALPQGMETQIFESLVSYREHERRAHMGFGLYVAKLIAEAHNGQIVASNLHSGGGVQFELTLPRTSSE